MIEQYQCLADSLLPVSYGLGNLCPKLFLFTLRVGLPRPCLLANIRCPSGRAVLGSMLGKGTALDATAILSLEAGINRKDSGVRVVLRRHRILPGPDY